MAKLIREHTRRHIGYDASGHGYSVVWLEHFSTPLLCLSVLKGQTTTITLAMACILTPKHQTRQNITEEHS